MAKTQFLTFYIALTDPELVKEYQAKDWFSGPLGELKTGVVNRAPLAAATEFGAPFLGWKDPKGVGPYSWSPWAWDQFGGANGPYPLNVATFTRKTGGFWGLFKTTVKYYWMGQFVYVPGADPVPAVPGVPTPVPLRERKWVQGFEVPLTGGGITGGSVIPSRDASRHPDGFGLALRSVTNGEVIQSTTQLGVPSDNSTWERLYIRLRRLPNGGSGRFWRASGSIQAASGATMEITADGRLAVYRLDGGGVANLVATSAATLESERFYKLDVLHKWALNDGRMEIFKDGAPFLSVSGFSNSGLGATQNHAQSILGSNTSTFDMELDVDDWEGMKIPAPSAGQTFGIPEGVDWQQGTKITVVRPRGDGANRANWTGDWRQAMPIPPYQSAGGFPLQSGTSGAVLEFETDAAQAIDAAPGAIGMAAIVFSVLSARGGAAVGSIGYQIAGAAAVDTPIVAEGLTRGWANVLYHPAALVAPIETTIPLRFRYIKGADASTANVWAFLAQASLIGTFGPEDQNLLIVDDPPPDAPTSMGPHNSPYPRSPWAYRSQVPPTMPVVLQTGQYTGNATGADLAAFNVPPCFIYIRPLANNQGGTIWFSSMLGAHSALSQGVEAANLAEALLDPDYAGADVVDAQQARAMIRRTGTSNQANANAATYQYFAFCDPAMRFALAGAVAHKSGSPTADHLLYDPFFEALWGYFVGEADAGTGGATKVYFKGPGHAAATWQLVNGAQEASALTFGTGEFETTNVVHDDSVSQLAYCLFRDDDFSDDEGRKYVLVFLTWAGDGNASRTFNFDGDGKAPCWAMAQSLTAPAGGFMRDAAHTTNTSSPMSGGANSSTGITGGGIEQFSVGSSLNAAGQNYQAIIFLADTDPGPNGFGPIIGIYVPVDPGTRPINGPWPEEPPEPVNPPPDDEEPPEPIVQPPDLADDLEACPTETHRFANLALSRVGVSQQVLDLSVDEDGVPAETSEEAVALRLQYSEAIRSTLRDFPWPFATRYADLVLLEGEDDDPVNGDWTFSYRKPGDCVFERRLVTARGGAVDPTPPAFALSSDDEGGIIFTNEADARLEYTARPLCVAVHGDALFVDAALWRLAAAIAPALSRMTDKVTYCMEQYDKAIAKAELVLRPGNPGARDATPIEGDDGAGCMAANVAVANLALVRLGARTITSLTADQSREAQTVRLIFEQELRAVLREFAWPFATRYVTDLEIVEGELGMPVNDDWVYAYRLPEDVLYARRLVTSLGRTHESDPFPFRLGSDADGRLLYANEEDVTLEYTIRPDCAVSVADDLFRDALAWRLAFTLAPSLAQVDPEVPEQIGRGPKEVTRAHAAPATKAQLRARAQGTAWLMYQRAIGIARSAAANEGQQDLEGGDAPWIKGR